MGSKRGIVRPWGDDREAIHEPELMVTGLFTEAEADDELPSPIGRLGGCLALRPHASIRSLFALRILA